MGQCEIFICDVLLYKEGTVLWVGLEVNVETTKVRSPSALQIATGQKQPENVEYFSCLGTVTTNGVRCTPEVKSRSAIRKAAFNNNKTA
jgi:hypothetical protein